MELENLIKTNLRQLFRDDLENNIHKFSSFSQQWDKSINFEIGITYYSVALVLVVNNDYLHRFSFTFIDFMRNLKYYMQKLFKNFHSQTSLESHAKNYVEFYNTSHNNYFDNHSGINRHFWMASCFFLDHLIFNYYT
jgi:hypothetical protein